MTRVIAGAGELERGPHLPVRAAPGKLGGQVPQVDAVFVAKGARPYAMLLVMVLPAQADMGSLPLASIVRGQESGLGVHAVFRLLISLTVLMRH
jgi:hypothetical protein